ncbi:hypothetical protein EsH8_I_000223 [Colletotrichum jinshuiense]
MADRAELGVLVRVMYRDSVAVVRNWLFGDELTESHVSLLEDEEMDASSELAYTEPKPSPHSRGCLANWHPKKALTLLWVLLPSFIARPLGYVTDNSAIPPATSTSYLNGLRGLASLIVAIQHNTDEYLTYIRIGWGDAGNKHAIQLPFLRVLTSGGFMVTIFFVISGFALAYSPLKKTHAGQSADAIGSLPSSIFRRPLRLFLPTVPVLIVTIILIHFGAFYIPERPIPIPPYPGGFWSQVEFLWHTLLTIVSQSTTHSIMPQAWTLSAEYQGSLLVFLSCMAFARVSPPVRIVGMFAAFYYMFDMGRWQQCLFLYGMFLADLRHIRAKLPSATEGVSLAITIVSVLFVILALFLGGWPLLGNGYNAIGYTWLTWVPTHTMSPFSFFLSLSAILLVGALENLPLLQRALNARWVQYLGEISYGLYLVHWVVGKSPIAKGVTMRMFLAGYSLTGAWAGGFAIAMVVSIWLADIHWRLVDQKSVQFSHWLSKKMGI